MLIKDTECITEAITSHQRILETSQEVRDERLHSSTNIGDIQEVRGEASDYINEHWRHRDIKGFDFRGQKLIRHLRKV